ncbi:MAG: AMP-binding protein, partial [Flammeovirgaceae bacterium]
VVINSVIQNFGGVNYLREVLGKSIEKMKPRGILYVGDVMDLASKSALLQDIRHYRLRHNMEPGPDFQDHKFYSREFFNDLPSNLPGVETMEISGKIGSIQNELTRFRFDAIIRINKSVSLSKTLPQKLQMDGRDLVRYPKPALEAVRDHTAAEQPAFISFSSDPEGRPKGAVLNHANLTHQLRLMQQIIGDEKPLVVLQSNHASFHISTWEYFVALLQGGTT